ncbi:MAG: hypothetical protein ACE3L7_21915 [Candidatus Pristimantibacillus sp.]
MNLKNRNLIIAAILVLIAASALFLPQEEELYGNDEASIKEIISTSELVTGEIAIVDRVDKDDTRIVSFFENGQNPGIAVFKQNKAGNYEYKSIEKASNTTTHAFLAHYGDFNKIYVFVTNEPKLAQIKLTINDKYEQTKEITEGSKSMVWFDLDYPESQLEFHTQFLDREGNELT